MVSPSMLFSMCSLVILLFWSPYNVVSSLLLGGNSCNNLKWIVINEVKRWSSIWMLRRWRKRRINLTSTIKNLKAMEAWEYFKATNGDWVYSSQHLSSKFFISPPCRPIFCTKSLKHNNSIQRKIAIEESYICKLLNLSPKNCCALEKKIWYLQSLGALDIWGVLHHQLGKLPWVAPRGCCL